MIIIFYKLKLVYIPIKIKFLTKLDESISLN